MVVKGTNLGVGSKNANCNLVLIFIFKITKLKLHRCFHHIPGPVNSGARSAEVAECFVSAGLCGVLKAEESGTSLEYWSHMCCLGQQATIEHF